MPALPVIDSAPRRRAFTLVELLAAMSALTVLVLMLSTLFTHVNRAWVTGSGNTERRRSTRALGDHIAGEMRSAMIPIDPNYKAGSANLQFLINPTSHTPADCQNSDSIFWQAPLATESSWGDIAEVGYFVRWKAAAGARPTLCRFFVNPSVRDAGGLPKGNPDFQIYNKPIAWLSGAMVDQVAPGTKAEDYRGLFGENVLGLWIRSYGLDGIELPREFDSRIGYDCQMHAKDLPDRTEKRYLPAKIVVSLAQVDSHSAERLDAAASSIRDLVSRGRVKDADEFLTKFRSDAAANPAVAALLPGVRVYSTQVYLLNAR